MAAGVAAGRLQDFFLADELKDDDHPELPAATGDEPSISMAKASYTWSAQGDAAALHDVQLDVPRGQLLSVVGGTGQGWFGPW